MGEGKHVKRSLLPAMLAPVLDVPLWVITRSAKSSNPVTGSLNTTVNSTLPPLTGPEVAGIDIRPGTVQNECGGDGHRPKSFQGWRVKRRANGTKKGDPEYRTHLHASNRLSKRL